MITMQVQYTTHSSHFKNFGDHIFNNMIDVVDTRSFFK
jgi:hypothetical protein